MPAHPKPHIKLLVTGRFAPWIVIFTNPLYPHTRYTTGHHARTIQEAWQHVHIMCEWYGCPIPKGAEHVR